MQTQFPNTAIFILARNEEIEARNKNLSRQGPQVNQAIIRQMNHETVKVARSTGLTVFFIDGELHPGESFGKKLEEGFLHVFAAGFEYALAIGNDCPALSKRRLLAAAEYLRQYPFVIGPAADGGVYLIGARKDSFPKVAFQQLPWMTGRLCKEIQKSWSVYDLFCLPEEHDLDQYADLSRILHSRSFNYYIKAVRKAIPTSIIFVAATQPLKKDRLHAEHIHPRGPPEYISVSA